MYGENIMNPNQNEPQPVGFRQLFDCETSTLTYLLWDLETKTGVIIDPVREQFERDLRVVGDLGIELVYALDTHVHADHITSLGMLREALGLCTAVGEPSRVPCADILLKDGETLQFGKHTLTALSTPGHTDACTSFLVENKVFTGDTLFIRGCGRTDFQQGDPFKLYRSITEKLYTLPDDTLVFPGHDYKGELVSTIGEEKQHNPRVSVKQTEVGFVTVMNAINLPRPKHIDEAVPANLRCGISVDHGHLTEEAFGIHDLQNIHAALSEGEAVVDCRTQKEYEAGHIPGALNVPMGNEFERLGELQNLRKIYLYCHSGRRAQAVYATLASKGLDNMVCLGSSGMADWISCRYSVEQ